MRRGAPHHLDLNVSDLERSTAFYTDVLGDLGYAPGESGDGWRTLAHTDGWYLCLVQTDDMGDDREENYAVFFEDPDRVKLEVVARGPRS
jgi:catechol 2,3-dioxygenase-like lactoylglutathione lyase family enzyme